jgi:mannan endo-1,4-beta-mannosidase
MDQYVVWHKRKHHHEFYTDPGIRQQYKTWVQHVVTRKNTINGRLYRDDPTIFSWELANEPRAIAASGRDSKTGWDKSTITSWADEMSAYIKSLDPNHMVSVGDEGFLDGGGSHWAYNANDGVDHKALTALPNIDFGTFHLYPEDWNATLEWGDQWIVDHLRVARELGKPTVLEEYGTKVTRSQGNLGEITRGWEERARTYQRWNDIMLRRGGNGSLVWMLAGKDNDQPRYPDYDRFAFWHDSKTGLLLSEIAQAYPVAPACQAAGGSRPSRSPFVRVRGPAADMVAALEPAFWTL